MSTLIVPVATIDALEPHNNADTLELAQILGWQLVVKKGQYVPGDRVVYFPLDAILPLELSDKIGVTQYLDKGRIRCTRLRGEPSFGLAITPDDPTWEVGQNVAEHYGVSRWEPPLRGFQGQRGGPPPDALPEHPLFPRYTTIENMRNFPTVFEDGELVAITEKIHGANCRVGIVEGEEIMTGSHRLRRKPQENVEVVPLYWFPFTLEPVRELLVGLSRTHKQVVLYGEIYGSTIQSLHYGCQGNSLGFRAFDLLIDGKFLDVGKFYQVCAKYDVARVPLLETYPFSLAHVKELSEGTTTLLEHGHMREGVVVKPLYERTHPKIGRCILKYVGDTYLLGKKTDFAEE